MAKIDWGTFPTWVSAVLTGGSLLLGFYILLRDRRKEERREASSVVCWERPNNTHFHEIHVLNATERPVVDVRLIIDSSGGSEVAYSGSIVIHNGGILPKQEIKAWCRRYSGSAHISPMAVRFQDADGIGWVRELHAGALHQDRSNRVSAWQLLRRDGRAALARRRDLKRRLLGGTDQIISLTPTTETPPPPPDWMKHLSAEPPSPD
ncbi:hypothetical protein [Streptomyces malaysiensis]|uniref:hypothetical protein n=1 Tax=Streptomyces malaysiensis TaxID=92644 RepID=UPI00142ECF2B|nr:hypothetical protein [Streptomyces malaysiensis]